MIAETREERIARQGRERSKRYYWRHLETSRERQREHAAKRRADPQQRELINMRKRANGAGVTPEQFRDMLAAQNGRCAICETTEPSTKAGAAGWNIDHCHRSGRVRFVLCNACNRGLAAFRDDPGRMRKAADLISRISGGEA